MTKDKHSLKLNKINKLKKENTLIKNFSISELLKLPILSGIINLSFNNKKFLMLNIENDDGVVLKYLWRDQYEPFSLKIWY